VQVKVKEVRGSNGGKNQYSFSPSTVRGNVGDIITFVNQSDAAHALISTPTGWITGSSILDVNETQAIELLKPGSFTISSQEHPEAKLSASVGGSSNDVLPPQAVVLSEKQGAKASYSFSPTDIGVDLSYGALIVNQTAETQILMITPAQGAVEGSIIDKNETQLMQFTQEFNYIVSSKAHPEAKVMICVD
jgi:hypothetical protein